MIVKEEAVLGDHIDEEARHKAWIELHPGEACAYASTREEAVRLAIAGIEDGLADARTRLLPSSVKAGRPVDQVLRDLVAIAREAHAVGLKPGIRINGDVAVAFVSELGAEVRTVACAGSEWSTANHTLDRYGVSYLQADGDTRKLTAPAAEVDELEAASNDAIAAGAAGVDRAQADLLHGTDQADGPGGGDAAIADEDRPF